MIQTSLFALLEMSTVVMLVTGVFLKKECQKHTTTEICR